MPYMSPEGIRDAFSAYNAVIREVAQARAAILVDGEDEIPSDEQHFTDSVHLTKLGCQKMSERILQRLRGRPEFAAWR